MVELPKNAGFATAFCIKSSGVFVTNPHVVQGMKLGDQVTLILDPSLETQRVVESKIVRIDTETDFAILRSVSPDTFVCDSDLVAIRACYGNTHRETLK